MLACQIFCFYILGVYKGVWENTSVSDLLTYIKGITGATVLSMMILLFVYRFQSFSRAVFIIYWILMLVLVSLSRLSFRLVDEEIKRGRQKGKPTLIYGAGVGGQLLVKEIEHNQELELVVVGFIDDNPRKHRRTIMGYPVLGSIHELEKIIKKKSIRGDHHLLSAEWGTKKAGDRRVLPKGRRGCRSQADDAHDFLKGVAITPKCACKSLSVKGKRR